MVKYNFYDNWLTLFVRVVSSVISVMRPDIYVTYVQHSEHKFSLYVHLNPLFLLPRNNRDLVGLRT